jgi:hypothetical protein
MEKRPLNEEECAQSSRLLHDLGGVLARTAEELDVQSLGVVTTALSSLLLGAIALHIPASEWVTAIDLIFNNMKRAALAHAKTIEFAMDTGEQHSNLH